MVDTRLECKHCGRESKSRKKCTYCQRVMGDIVRPVKGANTVHKKDEHGSGSSRDPRALVKQKRREGRQGGPERKGEGESQVDAVKEGLLVRAMGF